ncbi:MAG: pectinesterase family protein [Gemmatimonadota bacterium]
MTRVIGVRHVLLVGLALAPLHVASAQQTMALWPAAAPGAHGSTDADTPTLTTYAPPAAQSTRTGVLVFPGGGYDHLSSDKEGVQVARWLNTRGITAFVVKYRFGPRYQHPVPEQDGLRAIRVVRANAARFGILPSRIAVLGFSAGGHLAGSVATRWTAGDPSSGDLAERESARPDAALLVYPVVTMRDPYVHPGSRLNLLGVQPRPEVLQATSLESQVRRDTPPTFLVASTDDRSVPVENSLQFYQALRVAGVAAELHVYERGRHGFGLAADDPMLSTWTGHAAAWLSRTFAEPRVAPSPAPDTITNAIVDSRFTGAAGTKTGGVPTYRTVNAAVEAAPNFPQSPWTIRVRAGRYQEKVSVDKPNIRIIGASRDSTIITWGDVASTPAPGGGTLGTRGTWTLRATQADFQLERVTVENSFDYDANARKAATDSTKIRDTQGLAVAITDKADRTVLHDIVMLGHQDTFFADAGRTYVRGSRIVGNVDFIFGSGRLVCEECDIVSLDRGSTTNNGYIAAPSTDIASYGMLFLRSRLLKASPAMAKNSVSLGRPWHPGGNPRAVGMAVFIECYMDDHIAAKGWDRMSAGPMTNGERMWFEPEHARFAEYRSTGPGAVESPTRRRLSDGDATSYTKDLVLDGWKPEPRP